MKIDDKAHDLMQFYPVKGTHWNGHTAFYHEKGLYSVRNQQTKILSLVYANSPYDAINKVVGHRINVVQNGNNNVSIGSVESMVIK